MKRKVLVDFDYAFDGVHANRLKAGRSYEIRDEHVARFEAEGKIEAPACKPWRRMPEDVTFDIVDFDKSMVEADEVDAPGRKRRRKPKAE